MKKFLMLMAMFGLMNSVVACGGDDEPDVPDVPAPKLVSVTPANGATDIAVGDVNITVEFDQNIFFVTTNASKISITGGSITSARAVGKQLNIVANCPTEGTTVSVTIPEGLVNNTQQKSAATVTFSFITYKTPDKPEPQPDGHELAVTAVKNMGPGWNLGNTLDSYGSWIGDHQESSKYERAWGQPITDSHLMKAFKEKGFGAIRVPVTWYQHMAEDGTVDVDWMNRVEEIVNYVLDAGMYCILNVHHDTGAHDESWIRADANVYSQNKDRFAKLWTQIAQRFEKYGEKLLFEGYNEMLDNRNTWTNPVSRGDYAYTSQFAQTFVDAVRATGGNNLYRNLVVTTYSAAHSQQTLAGLTIPTDPCGNQNHLVVEVHSYDPWDWVNRYNMTWTEACTNELKNMFADLNTYFILKGYPVIVGEYGSNGDGEKTINASSTVAQKAEAGRQAGDMTRLCKKYGATAFYWMGLIEGNDRSEATFKWTMEQVADSIVNAYRQ